MAGGFPYLGSELAIAQLAGRMQIALRLYRKITGLSAVASFVTTPSDLPGAPAVHPAPVHPLCSAKVSEVPEASCDLPRFAHNGCGPRCARTHIHLCPLGLRCACVPIRCADRAVGVAKLVAEAELSEPAFGRALGILTILVSRTSQDHAVELLSQEVQILRESVAEFQGVPPEDRPLGEGPGEPGTALVAHALAHLRAHYTNPALGLPEVATAVGCSAKYLCTRFTEIVGERMHSHLLTLRISHACRLLVDTDLRIKEIAHASGFSSSGAMAHTFRSHVGISPSRYRSVFARPSPRQPRV